MVEYATLLSISFRNWLHGFNPDFHVLIPGILIAGALVLIVVGLFRPPRV